MVTDMSKVYVFTRQFYFILLCFMFPSLLFVPCLYCCDFSLKGEIYEPAKLSWREGRIGVCFCTNILPGNGCCQGRLVLSSFILCCFLMRKNWDDNG